VIDIVKFPSDADVTCYEYEKQGREVNSDAVFCRFSVLIESQLTFDTPLGRIFFPAEKKVAVCSAPFPSYNSA
jgi:hypothetical protein